MKRLEVLSVASEVYPLIKTGGLADVAGALPLALAAEGVRVRTLLPGYPAVLRAVAGARSVTNFPDLFGGRARLLSAKAEGLDLLVLDAPHLFDREGGPYADEKGRDWPDNAYRFAALARAAAEVGRGAVRGFRPAVVHAHDWQAGLTPAYLVYGPEPRPGLVMTVHNLAFQGRYPAELFPELELPPEAFTVEGVEYYGGVGYLKAGLALADRITTVSPTYAAEIATAEAGMGLDGLIRGRADRVSGILNGVDVEVWNPATDANLPARYDAGRLEARRANKAALCAELGLAFEPDTPLFVVISRLGWQKGLDLLLAALPWLVVQGAQLALLGAGDAELEAGFAAAASAHPGRVGCRFGYDEALAHRMQGGGDAILVPSRFEPCGLTQLCGLRYGCVPVVARVGGLADTIIDASPMALAAGTATGVQFAPTTLEMLEHGIRRAVGLYRQPETWRALQRNGMATDVSWRDPARRYAALYRELAAARA